MAVKRRNLIRRVALALVAAMVIATPAVADSRPPGAALVRSWVTDLSTTQRITEQPAARWQSGRSPAGTVIVVDPTRRYQQMTGFGASMTDSSAYVLSKLPAKTRSTIMTELFSSRDGIGLSMLRNPIGASDFARSIYSYDDQPAGETDAQLTDFSLAHDRAYIIPRIAEAKALNPKLVTMGTPWSPPGWMKTSDSMIQGSLKERYYAAYAKYLVSYLEGYARAGVPVDFVSAQNEPLFAPDDYPGMFFSPDEAAAFIGDDLGPAIAKSGQRTKILGYDHNWDITAYPEQLYADPQADRAVDGTAWHCYAGDVTAQSVSHNAYPHAPAYLTECSGGAWQEDPGFALTMNLMIGVPRNWGQSVVLWNLALDADRGPFVGGCDTCRGVVTVNDDQTVTKELEYYALGQTTRFVEPGAVRVASSQAVRAGAEDQPQGIVDVAYTNPDGSGVLVAYNSSPTTQDFSIKVGERYVTTALAAGAAGTWTWADPGRVRPVDPGRLGWVDLDLGRGPKGTPTGQLVQSVSPAVLDGLNQVRVGGQWLAYSLPYGAELRTRAATPVPRESWSVTTSCPQTPTCAEDSSPAGNVLDGDPSTRWSSGTGQAEGMAVEVDLGRPTTFSQIQLDTGTSIGDFVRSYDVQASTDGVTWAPIARGPGSSGAMTISLPQTTTRYLRIVSRTDSGSWWSITELTLASATGSGQQPSGTVRSDRGRLSDGTIVLGSYNAGRRAAVVALPVTGFDYSYLLPPRAAVTFAVWPG